LYEVEVPETGWESINLADPGEPTRMSVPTNEVCVAVGESLQGHIALRVDLRDYSSRGGEVVVEEADLVEVDQDGSVYHMEEVDPESVLLCSPRSGGEDD